MTGFQSIRTTISDNKDELVVYTADNFPQFPRRDAAVTSKSDRALASAHADDLVVLHGELDQGLSSLAARPQLGNRSCRRL